MPNIKKLTYQRIVNKLKDEIINLNRKRYHNKWEIKKLAERQQDIKKEQTALVDLIRDIEGKIK